jgi:hypothetical protein
MIIIGVNGTAVRDLQGARELLILSGRNVFAVFDGRQVRTVVVTVK